MNPRKKRKICYANERITTATKKIKNKNYKLPKYFIVLRRLESKKKLVL